MGIGEAPLDVAADVVGGVGAAEVVADFMGEHGGRCIDRIHHVEAIAGRRAGGVEHPADAMKNIGGARHK